MRFPIKFVVCANFILPILAAFAVSHSSAAKFDKRLRSSFLILGGATLVVMTSLVAFAFFQPLPDQDWLIALKSGMSRAIFLSLTLGIVLALGRIQHKPKQLLIRAGLLAIVWLDVFSHAPPQNPAVDPSVYSTELLNFHPIDPRPTLGESRAALSFDANEAFATNRLANQAENFLLMRLWSYQNANLLDQIPKVDGFFSLYLAPERDVHFRLYGPDNQVRPLLADFLSISQVTAREKERAFEWSYRDSHLPWVTLGAEPIFLDAPTTLTNLMLPTFHPREVVFLPRTAKPYITATHSGTGRILSRQFSTHRLMMQVETTQPTMLVVSQAHYHPWKAYVDGTLRTLWRANHAFQALEVPAGRHEVKLVYQDSWFRLGAIVSGLTALGCAVWWRSDRQRSKTQ